MQLHLGKSLNYLIVGVDVLIEKLVLLYLGLVCLFIWLLLAFFICFLLQDFCGIVLFKSTDSL
jgi:hypothetical protein